MFSYLQTIVFVGEMVLFVLAISKYECIAAVDSHRSPIVSLSGKRSKAGGAAETDSSSGIVSKEETTASALCR